MICLTERYLGCSRQAILGYALGSGCVVFCRRADGKMLGAHFPLGCDATEIADGCSQLVQTFAARSGTRSLMLFLSKSAWRARRDMYARHTQLADDLRRLFGWSSGVWVCDKDRVGACIDLRLSAEPEPANLGLGLRIHDPADSLLDKPAANVRFLRAGSAGGHATIEKLSSKHRHRMPHNTSSFKPMSPSLFWYL